MKTSKTLLVIPPLTQINTPYPSTAYLTGYLKKQQYPVAQMDLGIEMINEIFSKECLSYVFDIAEEYLDELSSNCKRMTVLRNQYENSVDTVMKFLKGQDDTISYKIVSRKYLPEAKRFDSLEVNEKAFGMMAVRDKARYMSTLFLEDLGDFIREVVSPEFAFTKYNERIATAAKYFDELNKQLNEEPDFVDEIYLSLFLDKIESEQPHIIGFSVPFPGNVFAAFKCAQLVKDQFPDIKTMLGGGYVNTELRDLKDQRVFDYFDFITYDDGEIPVKEVIDYVSGKISIDEISRCLYRNTNGELVKNGKNPKGVLTTYTPSYEGLDLTNYLSVIDVINPMHRLWSDGQWNKLTMAHGCYWKKCTFCDIGLDYIGNYEPQKALVLVDHVQKMIKETGVEGFHFVDEAAPPSLLRDFSVEIIKREIQIQWWVNIRYEKNFTEDLCLLMAKAGCIAVTGGLETASDRLLTLIDKGVTVEQVAKVSHSFDKAGIMVHAYLMYGFPTETVQETIDSLEIVRQLFKARVLHSAYWHRFTTTIHSPVGRYPEKFKIKIINPEKGTFANNDLEHEDLTGLDHGSFTAGLNASLYNYLHGHGLDFPLQDWFDFDVPKTSHLPDLITTCFHENITDSPKENKYLLWIGNELKIEKKGKETYLVHYSQQRTLKILFDFNQAQDLLEIVSEVSLLNDRLSTVKEVCDSFFGGDYSSFQWFWNLEAVKKIREEGLLIV